jgi:hypothetical protein
MFMGTVIITGLVTLLAIFAVFSSFKNKNYLGLFFSVATVLVFGFFTIMTLIFDGFPEA